MFFILGFLCLFASILEAVPIPICHGIEYSGILRDTEADQEIVLTFNFNLDVTFYKENLKFPNTIFLSNFTTSSLSSVHAGSTLVIDYAIGPPPQDINMTDTLLIQNTAIRINHEFNNLLDSSVYHTLGIILYVNNGLIFDGDMGNFMDENNNFCLYGQEYDCGFFGPLNCSETACCRKIEYIEIPDVIEENCETFETNAIIPTQNINHDSINYTFHAVYHITPINTEIIIVATNDIKFMFNPLNIFFYECSNFYSTATNFTCPAVFPMNDFQWEMNLNVDPDKTLFVVGEFLRRNGTFFKDSNVPFTSNDPCKNYAGIDYKATFCCTNFTKLISEMSSTIGFESSTNNDINVSMSTIVKTKATIATIPTKSTTITHVSSAISNHKTKMSLILSLFICIFL